MGPGRELPVSTDTNSEEVRLERGLFQYKLERTISKRMVGESLAVRHSYVRDEIFGHYKLINEHHPTRFVRDRVIPEYPKPRQLAEAVIPAMVKFIDSEEDRIAKLSPEERSSQGFRLAVLEYMLGITAHQDADGNGQTNRLVALSYIRQFCPEWNGSYLPTKYSDRWGEGEAMASFSRGLLDGTGEIIPFNMDQSDYRDFKLVQTKYREARDTVDSEALAAYNLGQEYDILARQVELTDKLILELKDEGVKIDFQEIASRDNRSPYAVFDATAVQMSGKYPDGYFGIL